MRVPITLGLLFAPLLLAACEGGGPTAPAPALTSPAILARGACADGGSSVDVPASALPPGPKRVLRTVPGAALAPARALPSPAATAPCSALGAPGSRHRAP